MKKIPTLFKRDFTNNGMIIPEYDERAQWVVDGEGVATRKYDGTSVLIRDGHMFKRYEVKAGRPEPTDFELADEDKTTGKKMGWVAVGWGSEDKWFIEAIKNHGANPDKVTLTDGTYELLGEKVQGNPEKATGHYLQPHWLAETYPDVPTEFEALKAWLEDKDIEGIVWHHPDGRMVKIKKKDYRLKRNTTN